MSSILDSSKLIASIRRRAFIPRSQETFSNDDFLEMATEEINLGLMDSVMSVRGDYLVYFIDVPMVEDQTDYPIPNRAHGNKLRDASIVDDNGKTLYELTQISLEEKVDFERDYTYQNRTNFYMQNDCLVLNEDMIKVGEFVRMWFYMRPNKLVQNSRAGTISQISVSTTEVDAIDPLAGTITAISAATSAVITSTAHGLTSGKVIITGSDSTPTIDGTHEITVIDEDSFSIAITTTVAGTSASWAKGLDVYVITVPTVPTHFTSAIKYDVIGAESPNKINYFNIYANTVNLTLKTISFATSDAPALVLGDYITKAEETIVPNIPTELHPIVAQRVAVACLEAMGDEQNKQSAERKLAQMEKSALKIISNRVEGAPKKIKNRHGTLNARKRRW